MFPPGFNSGIAHGSEVAVFNIVPSALPSMEPEDDSAYQLVARRVAAWALLGAPHRDQGVRRSASVALVVTEARTCVGWMVHPA